MNRKRACRVLAGVSLAAGLVLLAGEPAPAFVLKQVQGQSSARWFPVRWPVTTHRVPFVLNDRTLEMLPNLAANSEPMAAVQSALQSWATAPPGLYLQGEAPDTDSARDGMNLVSIADTPGNRDVVKNFNAITLSWYGSRPSIQTYFPIVETDIIVSPIRQWATDGSANRYDLQSTLTHEFGHVLGLDHSPVMDVTMFPYGGMGQTHRRVLELDDLAGLRALYRLPATTEGGEIVGKVTTTGGEAVFGAHVVAADADGVVQAGVLTAPDGSFDLSSLPAGNYEVYAEPLRGTTTPGNYSSYYATALTNFRTAFAGTDRTRAQVSVAEGQTTPLDPIQVERGAPAVVPLSLSWSTNGRRFSALDLPLTVKPGDNTWLVLVGTGMDAVTDVRVSGSDFSVDMSQSETGTTTLGHSYLTVPVSVQPGARPGARNVILDTGTELEAFTGGIRVIPS